MNKINLHSWTLNPDEAAQLQEDLCKYLVLVWDGRVVNTMGGVDVIYVGDIARVAITVMTYPDMVPLVAVTSDMPLLFPYIPGLLAFRVGSAILTACEKLTNMPDVLLVHGHGIAHPRRCGLASHLGLWLEKPTIGVAKSRLYGKHDEAGCQTGNWSKLLDESDSSQIIGATLRSRENAKPIYISPGHLIDIQHSIEFVLASCRGYRLPEPIRWANEVARSGNLTR
jgi:deoxyribonuclease V